MKKSLNGGAAIAGLIAMVFAAIPAASFAAGVVLRNGGLGQAASNESQFGVAVCNGGTVAVTKSVPVSIAANGKSASVTSASAIAPGACEYSYVSYSQFAMRAGATYSVAVTIDPQKTLITNSDNQASYSVTVPGSSSLGSAAPHPSVAPTGLATVQPSPASANTANVNQQSGNIFAALWHWVLGLFGIK